MSQQILLLIVAAIITNVFTWTIATFRSTSRQQTLQRDFVLHQQALTLTDKRLRMVLRLVVDIAKKMQLEIRAADILEMADVLGGE